MNKKHCVSSLLGLLVSWVALAGASDAIVVAVDATKPGAALPNSSQVLTFWNGVRNPDGTPVPWNSYALKAQREYPVAEFVRYAEFMACTGGNKARDLFKNPDDRTVLDDYDFDPLVAACRGALELGLKPYLKLGNVPPKFTADYDGGEFSMNIRPPTDDLVHYRYMKACAAALREAFGRAEVRTWRFAVLTEADNTGWFMAKSKSKDEIREAFFRLYDYAAKAFEEELGEGLCFGTHLLYPMDPSCRQTQFSVEEFTEHCANGKNAATGKTGAPLRLLTASYYGVPDRDDLGQGRCTALRRLRAAVDKHGFKDVILGVDEGRVIVATRGREKRDIVSRAVGASYQAAFDVRVMKELFDDGFEYFASWGYFSGPIIHFEGVPGHHYFSSRELAKFAGLKRAPATVAGNPPPHEEVDAIAGVAADGRSVRAVVGRFRDKLVFTNRLDATVAFRLPKDWAGKRASASVLVLDDRNNWYCDWERDRANLGVTAQDHKWSPDDFGVMANACLTTERFRKIFAERLQPIYAARAASVRPQVTNVTVSADATFEIPVDFFGNGAAHVEIALEAPRSEREAVLFVEAHPDDLPGHLGTALRLAEKYDVHVVDFTHGELGCGMEKFLNGWTKKERTAEETEVCRRAGFTLHWCDAVDGFAYADEKVCRQIAEILKTVRPRAVFCHWPVDVHMDHVMSAAATMKAVQLAGIDPETYFHEQDIQSRGFRTAFYVDITDYVDRKAELARLYTCQNGAGIAKRKAESNRVYGRNSSMANVELIGVFPGRVKPGRTVFDGMSGVSQ